MSPFYSRRALLKSASWPALVQAVQENVVALVATAHDVLDRAGALDAQFTGHAGTLTPARSAVNKTLHSR